MILGREQHHNFDAGRTQLVSTRAVAGVLGMVGWVEPSWQAWDTVVFFGIPLACRLRSQGSIWGLINIPGPEMTMGIFSHSVGNRFFSVVFPTNGHPV